ncbi:MAG: hypothetical protein AABY22_01870 [Nanoarchaeota archaeon]
MKKLKQKQTEFTSLTYTSLASLIEQLKVAGYTEQDFENTEFELNYDSCYYESDSPSVSLKILNVKSN